MDSEAPIMEPKFVEPRLKKITRPKGKGERS
jgi:hypothetical protein